MCNLQWGKECEYPHERTHRAKGRPKEEYTKPSQLNFLPPAQLLMGAYVGDNVDHEARNLEKDEEGMAFQYLVHTADSMPRN